MRKYKISNSMMTVQCYVKYNCYKVFLDVPTKPH